MEQANLPRSVDYVLLPEVVAGSGNLGSFGCQDMCTVNRRSQMWDFLQFLLRRLIDPPAAVAREPRGYITFTLPFGATRGKKVYWFEKEIAWAKTRFGDDLVRVVNMANMTIPEQSEMMEHTAVILTNHGGGAASSIFLPSGAGVLSYWHGDVRFDHNVFETAGYIRVTWVSQEARSDTDRIAALVEHEYERTMIEWGRQDFSGSEVDSGDIAMPL